MEPRSPYHEKKNIVFSFNPHLFNCILFQSYSRPLLYDSKITFEALDPALLMTSMR